MRPRRRWRVATLMACGLASGAAAAAPADYIFSPVVERGEREIDSKAGIARDREGRSAWGGKLGIEYGLTAWWASEATLNFGREAGANPRLDSLEWENRFQFTTTAERPYEIGLLFEVEREGRSADGLELRTGPLLQAHWRSWQGNFNLLFERRMRTEGSPPTELGYQWQLRRHREGRLEWGWQGFGQLGPWDRWAKRGEQSHVLGPAVFVRLDADGDHEHAHVEAALLVGTGGAAPRATLRLQALVPF